MSKHVSNIELIGIGLYTVPEAALLLGVSPLKLRRWVNGYTYKIEDIRKEVNPIWKTDVVLSDGQPILSFRDLIEFKFVTAFLEKGIGFRAIRNCLDYAKNCVDSDRPFMSGRFRTDGQTIFLESLEKTETPKLLDLKKKQYVFKAVVERTFRDLDLEDDTVARWRPFKGKTSIVIDPKRSFGQPIAEASGVPTERLAEAVEAEGNVARVASLFEVDPSVVRDAVKFHEGLLAA